MVKYRLLMVAMKWSKDWMHWMVEKRMAQQAVHYIGEMALKLHSHC
jgi:hypothetical protein